MRILPLALGLSLVLTARGAVAQIAPNPFTEPPVLGPVKPVTMPSVVERRLTNGLRVLVVEHHELRAGDRGRGCLAARERDQRVGPTVDHRGRCPHRTEARGAVARSARASITNAPFAIRAFAGP